MPASVTEIIIICLAVHLDIPPPINGRHFNKPAHRVFIICSVPPEAMSTKTGKIVKTNRVNMTIIMVELQ
jgi:hypothetical protein